jgi:preprotein translocase subunit SecA
MRLFSSDRVASIMDKMGIEEGEVISAKMVTRAISNAQKKVEVRNFGIRKHLLEYDDVMNQQRQVVYDIRNQALGGEDMRETIDQILDDYIMDEIEVQSLAGTPDMWDWDHLKQSFASHIMVDATLEQIQTATGNSDLTANDIADWIVEDAKSVYKARESLLPEDVMRGFERFIILRTIDDKWKDHLYAMDQLREGINLRAYGQKNPLLEYKSEGFKMFQEMMADMNSATVQRLFRTQIQGMDQSQGVQERSVRNVQTSHQDTTGMGFQGQPQGQQANQPQQVRTPIHAQEKHGRNEKLMVQGPDGKQVEIKYKKLQNYLNKGYTQVS